MEKYRKISQAARRINNPAAYNMDTMTKLITTRWMTTLFEEYLIFSIKLGLVDLCLFEFAVYSGLLLLKKSFFNAFFLTAVASLYTVSLLYHK